ncbi:hypothetical protein [Spongiactinospora sp. TRM90649]|uniref:hypothetical protein n=1 Tax=Spongiactinospora sp. TRM90649 TaxID=3031114 RepID=UPI0023F62D0B|nr:hypothetical protein [Spongiactinospora sp. TRM90649]MDF5755794.1 hypothetical protein [Spongiactinospora sp. TRM90649]
MTEIYCQNEDHPRPTRAVARLSWLNHCFVPADVCVGHLNWAIRDSLAAGHVILVEPAEHKEGGYVRYVVTRQVKEIARLHRRAYSEPVKAILLEAPDHPHYEDLPDTLEERRKLPARFHTPHWLGDCTPPAWVCAVCWEDGVTCGWPCEVAAEQGGEVFAR